MDHNKEKQIDEMAKAIEQARIKATDTTNSMNYGFGGWYAKELYNAGYRKVSDVVNDVIDKIFEILDAEYRSYCTEASSDVLNKMYMSSRNTVLKITAELVELRKKYTESEDTDEHKQH